MQNRPRNSSSGFSLIEMLTVLAIFSMLAMTAAASFRNSRNTALLNDAKRDIVRLLEQARSRAATGVGTTNHGLYLETDAVTSFASTTYDGTGDYRLLPPSITSNLAGVSIIFTRLSGQANADATIILTNSAGQTATIGVTQNGAIQP